MATRGYVLNNLKHYIPHVFVLFVEFLADSFSSTISEKAIFKYLKYEKVCYRSTREEWWYNNNWRCSIRIKHATYFITLK